MCADANPFGPGGALGADWGDAWDDTPVGHPPAEQRRSNGGIVYRLYNDLLYAAGPATSPPSVAHLRGIAALLSELMGGRRLDSSLPAGTIQLGITRKDLLRHLASQGGIRLANLIAEQGVALDVALLPTLVAAITTVAGDGAGSPGMVDEADVLTALADMVLDVAPDGAGALVASALHLLEEQVYSPLDDALADIPDLAVLTDGGQALSGLPPGVGIEVHLDGDFAIELPATPLTCSVPPQPMALSVAIARFLPAANARLRLDVTWSPGSGDPVHLHQTSALRHLVKAVDGIGVTLTVAPSVRHRGVVPDDLARTAFDRVDLLDASNAWSARVEAVELDSVRVGALVAALTAAFAQLVGPDLTAAAAIGAAVAAAVAPKLEGAIREALREALAAAWKDASGAIFDGAARFLPRRLEAPACVRVSRPFAHGGDLDLVPFRVTTTLEPHAWCVHAERLVRWREPPQRLPEDVLAGQLDDAVDATAPPFAASGALSARRAARRRRMRLAAPLPVHPALMSRAGLGALRSAIDRAPTAARDRVIVSLALDGLPPTRIAALAGSRRQRWLAAGPGGRSPASARSLDALRALPAGAGPGGRLLRDPATGAPLPAADVARIAAAYLHGAALACSLSARPGNGAEACDCAFTSTLATARGTLADPFWAGYSVSCDLPNRFYDGLRLAGRLGGTARVPGPAGGDALDVVVGDPESVHVEFGSGQATPVAPAVRLRGIPVRATVGGSEVAFRIERADVPVWPIAMDRRLAGLRQGAEVWEGEDAVVRERAADVFWRGAGSAATSLELHAGNPGVSMSPLLAVQCHYPAYLYLTHRADQATAVGITLAPGTDPGWSDADRDAVVRAAFRAVVAAWLDVPLAPDIYHELDADKIPDGAPFEECSASLGWLNTWRRVLKVDL
jgi:hypothetical protein